MNRQQLVMIFILSFMLGIGVGMFFGINLTINKIVDIAPLFVNITLNEQIVDDALFRYNNNLGNLKCIYTSQQKE